MTTNNSVIQYVSFYNGANLLGNSYNAPFASSWANAPAGTYKLTAAVVYQTNWTAWSAVTNTVTVINDAPVTSMSLAAGPGTNFTLNFSGGAGSQFVLVSSTNVATPLTNWTTVATTNVTPGSFTVPIGPGPAAFYRIKSE